MIAIDTNVILYAIDRRDLRKRAAARALVRQLATPPSDAVLLWQVAGELAKQLRAWRDAKRITDVAFHRYLHLFRRLFSLMMPTPAILDRAIDLASRYSLSHWDSMIVAACLEAGIDQLYTEDMGAPRQIDGLQLLNPF